MSKFQNETIDPKFLSGIENETSEGQKYSHKQSKISYKISNL